MKLQTLLSSTWHSDRDQILSDPNQTCLPPLHFPSVHWGCLRIRWYHTGDAIAAGSGCTCKCPERCRDRLEAPSWLGLCVRWTPASRKLIQIEQRIKNWSTIHLFNSLKKKPNPYDVTDLLYNFISLKLLWIGVNSPALWITFTIYFPCTWPPRFLNIL